MRKSLSQIKLNNLKKQKMIFYQPKLSRVLIIFITVLISPNCPGLRVVLKRILTKKG